MSERFRISSQPSYSASSSIGIKDVGCRLQGCDRRSVPGHSPVCLSGRGISLESQPKKLSKIAISPLPPCVVATVLTFVNGHIQSTFEFLCLLWVVRSFLVGQPPPGFLRHDSGVQWSCSTQPAGISLRSPGKTESRSGGHNARKWAHPLFAIRAFGFTAGSNRVH